MSARQSTQAGTGVAVAGTANAASQAIVYLETLAKHMEDRGYTSLRVNVSGQPGIHVAHRAVSQLSETIRVAPAAGGGLWFWWSWGDPLSPAGDADAAASKIAYVLSPQACE